MVSFEHGATPYCDEDIEENMKVRKEDRSNN